MTEAPYLPIARPVLGAAEHEALRAVLADHWVGQGPRVARFEAQLAEQAEVAHAVALSSGTAALHLSLLALGLGPGDRVLVPSYSFVASAAAVLMVGAQPVLLDVDPATFNLSVADCARRARSTPGLAAILVVHQFGLPCDLEPLLALAEELDLPLIEDAACAQGAKVGGRPVGGLGRVGCLSFHPRKIITTGEGGAILTQDAGLAERVRSLRSHGSEADLLSRGDLPDVVRLGYNFRLSDLQAALGLAQMERFGELYARRRQLAEIYHGALRDLDWLQLPQAPAGLEHSWQSYVPLLRAADLAAGHRLREALRAGLERRGVATRPGATAIHTLRLYQEQLGYRDEDLPGALRADRVAFALPLHPGMHDEDVARVRAALLDSAAELPDLFAAAGL